MNMWSAAACCRSERFPLSVSRFDFRIPPKNNGKRETGNGVIKLAHSKESVVFAATGWFNKSI